MNKDDIHAIEDLSAIQSAGAMEGRSMKGRVFYLSSAYTILLLLFLTICAVGFWAVNTGVGGAWLFLWPPIFWLIRNLAFYVLPLIAVAIAFFAFRVAQGLSSTFTIALLNMVLVAALALAVWRIEYRAKVGAQNLVKKYGLESLEAIHSHPFIGQTLPEVPIVDLHGQEVNLLDQIRTAKVAVLVFFATYDTPWSDNIKLASQINRTMGTQGVMVIGIDEQESQNVVESFLAKENLAFPIYLDPHGQYFHALLLGTVEQILLVDGAGKVIAHPKGQAQLRQSIQTALSAMKEQGAESTRGE